jgi:hypothetical protein
MSQQNYIQDIDVPESADLLQNQLFYFSGFLFYVEGWSWDNITVDSNIQYEGVKDGLNEIVSTFASNPFKAIRDIKNNSSSIIPTDTSLDAGDSYRFPELYTVAATCRRFQIYNTWRPKYNDIISPEFFESYSQDIPTKTPLQEGELTWSLWAGDIQSFTNLPGGRLEIGSYIYTKKLSLQAYTPASIQNSTKNIKIGRGFGEINGKNITNYYNPVDAYADELSTLKNGWYGVVSLASTPYTFEAGRGINFDTFIKIESNIITGFHDDYPQNNISVYGQKQKQYIDS